MGFHNLFLPGRGFFLSRSPEGKAAQPPLFFQSFLLIAMKKGHPGSQQPPGQRGLRRRRIFCFQNPDLLRCIPVCQPGPEGNISQFLPEVLHPAGKDSGQAEFSCQPHQNFLFLPGRPVHHPYTVKEGNSGTSAAFLQLLFPVVRQGIQRCMEGQFLRPQEGPGSDQGHLVSRFCQTQSLRHRRAGAAQNHPIHICQNGQLLRSIHRNPPVTAPGSFSRPFPSRKW